MRECQPPKPSGGPHSAPWGGEGQRPGCSPWWEAFCPLTGFPSASSYPLPSCSELTPDTAHTGELHPQGTGPATPVKPRQPMAQGCPPPPPSAPDPWPCLSSQCLE